MLPRYPKSGFSSSSTAEEVLSDVDGTGLTAIVTGASSGIGFETARVLAKRGVHVVMAVRNVELGKTAKAAILRENPSTIVDVMEVDLSSMDSVRSFASNYVSKGLPLNILINNAGIMAPTFSLSRDQIEMHFATNHVGHFLLTKLLLDTMKKTAIASRRRGRIVNVSSEAHRYLCRRGIRFDEINDPTSYKNFRAYRQTKLANVLHANELARRLKGDGDVITANSLHPGVIKTNIFRDTPIFDCLLSSVSKFLLKNVHQGAATTCYVALHPNVEGVSGEYFIDNNMAKASALSKDADLAQRLWNFSSDLVK